MNTLEKLYIEYYDNVIEYAEKQFNRVIKPYLIKHKYDFITGNGTFCISKKLGVYGHYNYIDIDYDVPKYIRDVLQMEVKGLNNDLGSLMPDYTYNPSDNL